MTLRNRLRIIFTEGSKPKSWKKQKVKQKMN